MTNKEQIIAKALQLLAEAPHGMRYSELINAIAAALPGIPQNTIHGNVWNLDAQLPQQVFKPARGRFLHVKFKEQTEPPAAPPIQKPADKVKEVDFYKPFAEWLVAELEECTKAIPVGGNIFKDKWGTPDVIGVREPKKSDIIKFPTEIVSAEIKLDTTWLIGAFGQACAYRLFSHKSYLVVPSSSPEDDLARLDTLARIFGIGLILFDAANPKTPNFEIRVRAAKHEPDMFYVNRNMKYIEDELFP